MTGKIVVYNYSQCDAFYDGQHTNAITYGFDGEDKLSSNFCEFNGCTRCSNKTITTYGTLFTNKGYSKEQGGTYFVYTIVFNKDVISLYLEKTEGATFSYGVVAAKYTKDVSTGILFDEAGAPINDCVAIDATGAAYSVYSLKITDLDKVENSQSQALYCCAYVVDNGAIKYVADEITDVIRVTLQDALYDVELSSNRVPKELHLMLKDRINAVAAESFFGLAVVRIVEVSAQSEDLERFAKISQELYLSEKELDYLRRTNDFKNRLADTINEQELHQATTEQEFRHQLNIINRNKRNEELLNEDELRKFEHLLINERIVREAKNNAERDAALTEIAKTGLVRQEELGMLAHEAKTRNYQRGMALAMMQLRDGIEFERIRLEGEAQKAEMIIRKELELQGMRDDYQDSRFYKELDKQRAIEDAKLDLQQRQRDMDYNDVKRLHDLQREDDEAQFRQMMAMQEMEERSKENQRKHDAEMELNRLKNAEEMERMKWENAQHLSDEKVWALNGGEGAVAYAQNKYNADRERETAERLEAQRKEQDARLDAERAARDADQRDTKERMFEMMNNMMAMASGVQAQKMEDKERQLRERDERIRRQEGRMDTAYDRALDYTTRETTVSHQQSQQPQYEVHVQPVTSSAPAQPMVSKSISTIVCPECGAPTEVYSRITGYYRPVQNFNDGKAQEFKDRKVYNIENSVLRRDGVSKTVTVEEESSAVLADGVYLFATKSCPNCKAMATLLDKAGIAYKVIDAEAEPELAQKFGINQAPTLITDGVRATGVSPIKQFIESKGAKADV